jgi:Na+-driven multidrug efflux pump
MNLPIETVAAATGTTAANSLVSKNLDTSITINNLFTNATSIIALVAGMIAFIYLVYSGILYLTAAGNPDSAKKGQQGIINAIIGIIIIVAAWAIIGAIRGTSETLV